MVTGRLCHLLAIGPHSGPYNWLENTIEMFRRTYPVLTTILMICLQSACSQSTDAYICEIQESGDGRTIVFSSRPDDTVYIVTAEGFMPLGRAPFAISESGRWIVAVDADRSGPHRTVLVRRDMTRHRDDRLQFREPFMKAHVVELRCDDRSVYCQFIDPEYEHGIRLTPWLRMTVGTDRPGALHGVDATKVPTGKPVPCIQRKDPSGRTIDVYESSAGLKVVRTKSRWERSTIAREFEGNSQVLLKETADRFWSRQAVSHGFAYP